MIPVAVEPALEKFVSTLRSTVGLPYLWSPSWILSQDPLYLDEHVAVMREEEVGIASHRPVIFATADDAANREAMARVVAKFGDSTLVVNAVAGSGACVVAEEFGFVADGEWVGMCGGLREVSVAPAPSLAERPDLLPAVAELWSACMGSDYQSEHITADRLADLVVTNPLWNPELTFVVSDDDRPLGMVRASVDRYADGSEYGLVRGLAIPPSERARSSLTTLMSLYSALALAMEARGVSRLHNKVATGNPRLERVYGLVGLRPDCISRRFRRGGSQ